MKSKIKELIAEEVASAVLRHGEFNSSHEAYSIILEELEELEEEVNNIQDYFSAIWPIIRGKEPIGGLESLEQISEFGSRHGIKLIEEAIQVTAMFSKLKDLSPIETKTLVEEAIEQNVVIDNGDGTVTLPVSGSGSGNTITKEEYNNNFQTKDYGKQESTNEC